MRGLAEKGRGGGWTVGREKEGERVGGCNPTERGIGNRVTRQILDIGSVCIQRICADKGNDTACV